jgi:hypothetical protein
MMPKFRVRLGKTVHDFLEAYVEVEAANAEEAQEVAIDIAETVGNDVEFNFKDTLGDAGIEAIDCEEITDAS